MNTVVAIAVALVYAGAIVWYLRRDVPVRYEPPRYARRFREVLHPRDEQGRFR